MNNPTYRKALNWASSHLVEESVDQSAPRFILMMRHNWTTTELLLHYSKRMQASEWQLFQDDIARLKQFEPAQYIVGKEIFYGRGFAVSPAVLIPESETEELVEWVLTEFTNDEPLRVLDLGTGSGVIGITLKLERPNWHVTASDISSEALGVATQNAQRLNADIHFVQSDLFENLVGVKFDLIVTNPPYIGQQELDAMDEQVLQYEPDVALFADHQGMGFYDKLFAQIQHVLTKDGQLFGETGYRQEHAIKTAITANYPNAIVETRHDINDQMRMVRVQNF